MEELKKIGYLPSVVITSLKQEKEEEKESKSIGLEKKDNLNRARWRVGVGEIVVRVG